MLTRPTKLIYALSKYLILLALAFMSLRFPIPLLFGMNFSLTSLFLLLILGQFGGRIAMGSVVLTTLAGFYFLDQPAILALTILEIAFLGGCLFWQKKPLLIYDTLFWFICGIPLVLFLVYQETQQINAVGFLQVFGSCLNGLTNTLIAELLLTYFLRPINRVEPAAKTEFRQILFHLTLSAVVIPFVLFMFVTGWYQNGVANQRAADMTKSVTNGIRMQVSGWTPMEYRYLNLHSMVQLGKLKNIVHQTSETSGGVRIMVWNKLGELLVDSSSESWTDPALQLSEGKLYRVDGDLLLWLPREKHSYEMRKWKDAFYFRQSIVGSHDSLIVHVEIPVSVFLRDIWSVYGYQFGIALGFLLATGAACHFVSLFVIRHLRRLVHATFGLAEEIRSYSPLQGLNSNIREFQWLIENFLEMAKKLAAKFAEAEAMNKTLEDQAIQLAQSEDRLRHLAFHDSLTRLPNRLYIETYLNKFLQDFEEQPDSSLSILFMDLDKFKSINDTYGHDVGDELLKLTADRLNRAVPEGTACRIAGDEFVVLLLNIDRDETENIARRIAKTFEEPIVIGENALAVQASMGISQFPSDGNDPTTIFKHADEAMYKVKTAGGARYAFHSDASEGEKTK